MAWTYDDQGGSAWGQPPGTGSMLDYSFPGMTTPINSTWTKPGGTTKDELTALMTKDQPDAPPPTIASLMAQIHPDWSPESVAYISNLLTQQGITPEQYQANPSQFDQFDWEGYQAGQAAAPLRQAIATAHPDWSPVQIDTALAILQEQGVDAVQYGQYGVAIDTNLLGWKAPIAPLDPLDATPMTHTTICSGGTCVVKGSDGSVQTTYEDPDYKPGYTTVCANGVCTITDSNGRIADTYPDPNFNSTADDYGTVQTDPLTGEIFQMTADGQRIHVGWAPTGASTSAPTGSAGWGQEYTQGDLRYDPATGTMVRDWTKSPMNQQDALAQMQMANMPVNWYNTALQERTMAVPDRKFNNQVGSTVGTYVGAKQGFGSQFDLQQGQEAMNVTPAGYQNTWQQGYAQSATNPTGYGAGTQTGGYQTYNPSMQALGSMSSSDLGQMQGWTESGLAGTSYEDWMRKNRSLGAPNRYQGLTYR